jgi:integrase/recombinase XerD
MRTYLHPAEVALLEKAAANVRDRLLIRVLFHLGCRVSEALNLAVEDVDFDNGRVTIQHLKTRVNLSCPGCGERLGRKHLFCPKCGAKVTGAQAQDRDHRRRRILPMDSDTLTMLRDYAERGGPVLRGGKRLVFGINRHRAWQVVRACAERAGLPKLVNPETGRVHNVSPHRLRDSFAVMAVQRNDSTDSVRLLQEWLGHANIGTTMRYRKVAGEELKEWYDNLWSRNEEGNG